MQSSEISLNRITLDFPPYAEMKFRDKYFSDSLIPFRIAFTLVTLLYAVFGILDVKLVPEFTGIFHFIRFAIVVPLLAACLVVSFFPVFRKIWQEFLLVCFVVGGTGVSVMTILVPDNIFYYAGLMLIFMAGYFFIKLRFIGATIGGWAVLLIYNIGAVFFSDTTNTMLLTTNFFFTSANLIGMFAAHNIELYARRDFLLNLELDRQKSRIEEANRTLESNIEKRTAELRIAKEKAEESDRLKLAFLANMSHEIRTPMNGILGFAQLLKEPDLSGEDRDQFIAIINNSGKRMLNIINDIIDISKIESGLMNISVADTDILSQLQELYSFFRPEAEKKGLRLILKNTKDESLVVRTDREKLYAILTNLIKNSIKYTSTGQIEFGYELKNSNPSPSVQFFINDTGIGIPKDRQEAIFERFVQADISDKMARQGAGLGLSISKAYVEMLGGRIWLDSEESRGSAFYFTIPLGMDTSNQTDLL